MLIKLSSSDRALLSFKEIDFDKNKEYSFDEANTLFRTVLKVCDSYSEPDTIFDEELFLKYEELANKIKDQIEHYNKAADFS